jgi:Domain of unknown function (DUF5659)
MAETFNTSDYGLAAFLDASGFPITETFSKPNGTEVSFHFHSSPSLFTAISNYSSNAPIACRDYFHALRRTKALIRENTNDRSRRNARS